MKKIFCTIIFVLMAATVSAESVKDNYELQFEYLKAAPSSSRDVNNYNIHFFQKIHEQRALSVYRGITFTRAVGATNPRLEGIWKDSEGVGIDPAFMLRWDKKVSGKLHASWDFSGSLMFYNKAHPAEGRAYGFLWRTGPRLIWQCNEDDSVSLDYSVSHFSNGMKNTIPVTIRLDFRSELRTGFKIWKI